MLKKLYQWPEVIKNVSEELNVNAITTYAFELSNTFNSFYEAHPVIKADAEHKEQRLALVLVFKAVLSDALGLMGIVAPAKM